MKPTCPISGQSGKRVGAVTLESLVLPNQLPILNDEQWFFCDQSDCEAVYFSSKGQVLSKDALSIRVGMKEKSSPHPVCYCFAHTEESIQEEIKETGKSSVIESISLKVKAGECACELKNPKGSCCLGDIGKAVLRATRDLDPSESGVNVPADEEDCCGK